MHTGLPHSYSLPRLAWHSAWVAALALALGACQQDEVQLRLTSYERNRIDTLYARIAPDLRKETDSLCNATFAQLVQQAVDSIVQERLIEEELLRSRIPLVK